MVDHGMDPEKVKKAREGAHALIDLFAMDSDIASMTFAYGSPENVAPVEVFVVFGEERISKFRAFVNEIMGTDDS